YHYPVALDQGPTIGCSLNSSEFSPGDLLIGYIVAHNQGPETSVDAYIAFVLPDGQIASITAGGIAIGIYPWMTNVSLPRGFDFGPSEVFRTTAPQNPGDYLFAAALAEPGSIEFIGEPSLCAFTIQVCDTSEVQPS
ncbi:MAG: hypothetical protein JW941_13310, partial [Candidatus Coatesbacteria bacterium]|nr:hypothetical protein [Candidatus Coatesbacteria bacterium]